MPPSDQSPDRPADLDPALEPLVEALREVVGYAHAYRSGAPAGPELGWAIRNYNEIAEAVRENSDGC